MADHRTARDDGGPSLLGRLASLILAPVILVVVAVVNTLFSLYYYARIAYAMCFTDDGQPAIRAPLLGQLAVGACGLAILLTGTLWAGKLKDFSDDRSRDLYAAAKQPAATQVIEPVAETAEVDSTE